MNSLRRHIMMQQGGGGGIPPEYQQVEYIEADGTQYIVTNIVLDGSDEVELYAWGGKQRSGGNAAYYGVRQAGVGDIGLRSGFYIGSKICDWYYSTGTASYYQDYDFSVAKTHMTIIGGKATIDNGVTEVVIAPDALSLSFSNPIYLFALNNNGSASSYQETKLYYFAVTNKATLYPCYRKADNVAGMYDTLNNVFYVNAGTGSFIVGPDVN